MPLLQRRPTRDLEELKQILMDDTEPVEDSAQRHPEQDPQRTNGTEPSQQYPQDGDHTSNAPNNQSAPVTHVQGRGRGKRKVAARQNKQKARQQPSEAPPIVAKRDSSGDSVSSIDFDDPVPPAGDAHSHLPPPPASHQSHSSRRGPPSHQQHSDEDVPSTSYQSSTTRRRLKKRPGMRAPKLVSNEERLEQKYHELMDLLCRDFVQETAHVCEASLRESRMILQNTLATNRLVSQTLVDNNNSRGSAPPTRDSRAGGGEHANALRHSRNNKDHHHFVGWQTGQGQTTPYGQDDSRESRPERRNLRSNSRHRGELDETSHASSGLPPTRNPNQQSKQQLMGRSYPSPTPKSSQQHRSSEAVNEPHHQEDELSRQLAREEKARRQRSDNQLSNTDSAFVMKWLRRKNRLIRQQKKEKKENDRFERELDMELEKIRVKRQEMAREAFMEWSQQKTKVVPINQKSTQASAVNGKSNSGPETSQTGAESAPQTNGVEEEREAEEEEEKQKSPYRHNRPVHNYVFPRPTSAHSGGPQHHSAPKMKITGKQMTTASHDDRQPNAADPPPVSENPRLSYDEWVRRKRVQSARERSLSANKAQTAQKAKTEAELQEEAKWQETVRSLSRERRESRERGKKRVNSGLAGQRPSSNDKEPTTSNDVPVEEKSASKRIEYPLRPKSAKFRNRRPKGPRSGDRDTQDPSINGNSNPYTTESTDFIKSLEERSHKSSPTESRRRPDVEEDSHPKLPLSPSGRSPTSSNRHRDSWQNSTGQSGEVLEEIESEEDTDFTGRHSKSPIQFSD